MAGLEDEEVTHMYDALLHDSAVRAPAAPRVYVVQKLASWATDAQRKGALHITRDAHGKVVCTNTCTVHYLARMYRDAIGGAAKPLYILAPLWHSVSGGQPGSAHVQVIVFCVSQKRIIFRDPTCAPAPQSIPSATRDMVRKNFRRWDCFHAPGNDSPTSMHCAETSARFIREACAGITDLAALASSSSLTLLKK